MLFTLIKNILAVCTLFLSFQLTATPLFDTHLHYNTEHAKHFTAQQIINKLNQQNIKYAAVTSMPPALVQKLYRLAPEKIVPLLGVYRTQKDKTSWHQDEDVIKNIKFYLNQHDWRGIGELHITAKDRHSKIFHRIIKLAVKHQLPLMLHADPAIIDKVYDIAPNHPVIWAHAGTFPYPDLLADYLQRYPALHADLSVRDERIAHNGAIDDNWYELFIRFPDRFLIGVDTFSSNRWKNFGKTIEKTHRWLKQLPEDVAIKLKYSNAERLFMKKQFYTK